MNQVITAICAGCLTRVDASELENKARKCDWCRGQQSSVTSDRDDCLPAAPAIEDLHAGGHALLDQREFDGGAHLHLCDEV